jgi:hypothetical protein
MQIKQLSLTLLLAIINSNLSGADTSPKHNFTGSGYSRRCTEHTTSRTILGLAAAGSLSTSCLASHISQNSQSYPHRVIADATGLVSFISAITLTSEFINYRAYLKRQHGLHQCLLYDPLRR